MQQDDPLHSENAADNTLQPSIQPVLQQPPAACPFDFASFMRRSGGNTTTLLSVIREADAHIPPGPIVVYSERAGGSVRFTEFKSTIYCKLFYKLTLIS